MQLYTCHKAARLKGRALSLNIIQLGHATDCGVKKTAAIIMREERCSECKCMNNATHLNGLIQVYRYKHLDSIIVRINATNIKIETNQIGNCTDHIPNQKFKLWGLCYNTCAKKANQLSFEYEGNQ